MEVYEANQDVCRRVMNRKQRKKMNNKMKKKREEAEAAAATVEGGSDSDDEDESLSSVVFDPSVRRSLVRLLMEDQSMPQHMCIQRLCDCNFAKIPLPCNNSDEAIMKSIVTSAVNRQHIRRTVKTLYPMLMGMF